MYLRLGGGMADTRDFLPEAGPPMAEKSQNEEIDGLCVDALEQSSGAYVLAGDNGRYMYKGSTRDVRKRVMEHLSGGVARTRCRRPLKIVHVEYTDSYTAARKRENWLKTGQGRKWLKDNYAWVVEWQTQGT